MIASTMTMLVSKNQQKGLLGYWSVAILNITKGALFD